MDNAEELEKIEFAIRDNEGKLGVIRMAMEAIEREIDSLTTRKVQLDANVNYLKKQNIIALASEYRQIRMELAFVENKLHFVKIDRESHRTTYKDIISHIEKLKEEYIKKSQVYQDNVVYGLFGSKHDG